jgi:hypothetical protein
MLSDTCCCAGLPWAFLYSLNFADQPAALAAAREHTPQLLQGIRALHNAVAVLPAGLDDRRRVRWHGLLSATGSNCSYACFPEVVNACCACPCLLDPCSLRLIIPAVRGSKHEACDSCIVAGLVHVSSSAAPQGMVAAPAVKQHECRTTAIRGHAGPNKDHRHRR